MLVGRAYGGKRCEALAVLAQALAPELHEPRADRLEARRVRHADMDGTTRVMADELVREDEQRVLLERGLFHVVAHLPGSEQEFGHVETGERGRKEPDRRKDAEASANRGRDVQGRDIGLLCK